MYKAVSIFEALVLANLILTSCGPDKTFEERLDDAVGNKIPVEHSGIAEESTSENTSNLEEENQKVTTTNYVWGCNQCSKVHYQQEEPDIQNCPVGYKFNGGFGTTHNWRKYGKQGQNYFSCEFCGLNIQVENERPENEEGCNFHEYGQALTSAHHWEQK
jgi:hypothetical protein